MCGNNDSLESSIPQAHPRYPAEYYVALDQIDAGKLSARVYRTVRRLLDRAWENNGHLEITEADLKALCGRNSLGTMREHLGELWKAGIIQYKRANGMVVIDFTAWLQPPLQGEDADPPSDDGGGATDGGGSPTDAGPVRVSDPAAPAAKAGDIEAWMNSRVGSRHFLVDEEPEEVMTEPALCPQNEPEEAEILTRTRERALGGLGVSPCTRISSPIPEKKKPNPKPKPPERDQPRAREQQLALGLLVDREVGVSFQVAQILARSLPAQAIFKAVDDWLPDRDAGKVKEGALVYRLRLLMQSLEQGLGKVMLSAAFRCSELFERHRLPEEMIASDRKIYSIDPFDVPDSRRQRYSYNPYEQPEGARA